DRIAHGFAELEEVVSHLRADYADIAVGVVFKLREKAAAGIIWVPAFSKSGSVPCKATEAEVLPPPLTRIFWPKKLLVISRKGTATSTAGNLDNAIASSYVRFFRIRSSRESRPT